MMIIGLTGPSRSGKDSVAEILVKDFGYEQRAMAARIRELLIGLDPLLATDDGAVLNLGTLFKRCDGDWNRIKAESREATELMIRLGQTARLVLGNDIWLNIVMPPIDSFDKICISDCRQPNEYRAIKERGGKIWKVVRPGTESRAMDGLLDGLEVDARIDNRGSLVDLRGIVQAVIASDVFSSS